jgi:hypothetical protein
MKQRCPKSNQRGVGQIFGFRFIINSRGVATILPESDRIVCGVVWNLAAKDENNLDRWEGVRQGLYTKERLPVVIEGRSYDALVYVATDSSIGASRPGYIDKVIEAAKSQGLPRAYVAELESWAVKK